MVYPSTASKIPDSTSEVQEISELLGGARMLKHKLSGRLDAHELILQGIPGASLLYLIEQLTAVDKSASFENAVGMSVRTLQRRKSEPDSILNADQSARTWKFAQVLAHATRVFGSRSEAEQWMLRPAMGLEQRKPIDLMATPAGVELVEEFLVRLEYGVYA